MKIICAGNVSYDITFPIEEFPEENTKNRLTKRVECGGGPASTAAYLLGKWGIDVTFAGVVGNDLYGKRIKEEFEQVNVDTKYLKLSDEFATTTSFILANKKNGKRTVYTHRSDEMKLTDLALDFKPDIIYLDGQEVDVSNQLLDTYPNSCSIIDAGRPKPEIIELCKKVTYVVSSLEFAKEVTKVDVDFNNFETIKQLYYEMKKLFKGIVVITLEAKGSLTEIDGEVKIVKSIEVEAVDSTGAGDIFHGAFTYGIVNGFKLQNILEIANVTGAISVTRLGGRNSVPELKEVVDVYNESKRNNIY